MICDPLLDRTKQDLCALLVPVIYCVLLLLLLFVSFIVRSIIMEVDQRPTQTVATNVTAEVIQSGPSKQPIRSAGRVNFI